MSDGESVLARWSRRKIAATQGEATPEAIDGADAGAVAEQASPVAGPSPDVTIAVDDAPESVAQTSNDKTPTLPPIEELNAESDYTAFLRSGVPEAITRAALRKLWASDPVLANLDGLNNYDEDYNVVDQAITAAQTSYRPGLGYFDELEDKVAKLDDTLAELGAESRESSSEADLGPVDALNNGDAPKKEPVVASQQDRRPNEVENGDDSDEETSV
jgi:hypothetical protein